MTLRRKDMTLDEVLALPKRQQWLLLIFLCVLLGGVGYWMWVKETRLRLAHLLIRGGVLQSVLQQKTAEQSQLARRKKKILQQAKKVKQLFIHQALKKGDISFILENISKFGLKSGLSFEWFVPQTEKQRDFYVELPIKIAVTGHYDQLMAFMREMSHSSLMMIPTHVLIRRMSTTKKKHLDANTLWMELQVSLYCDSVLK
jgi:type IV pilus assembly protein PilO